MSDSSGWKAGELADTLAEGDHAANLDAVLSDHVGAGDMMTLMEEMGLEDSPFYADMQTQTNNDMLRRSRQQSDVASMSAATGLSDSTVEATGYDRLLNAIQPAAQQIVFRGGKGTGKTATALELIQWAVRDEIVEKVMTNVPVRGMSKEDLQRADNVPDWWLDPDENHLLGELAPNVRFGENISEFLEFAQEPGEKLALIDEFSTVGNAYTNQSDVQQIMGSAINAFRKSMRGSLRTAYVGHENDKDIHPLIRKQSDVVISKDGKASEGMADQATVYEGWQDYLAEDRWFKVRGIQDVPDRSPWRYDTNYFAHLEWDLDNPEKQIQRGQLIENWEQYQESDDSDDESERELVLCRGERTNGDDCKQKTNHVSGYCQSHRRDQWDGESSHPEYDDQQEGINP